VKWYFGSIIEEIVIVLRGTFAATPATLYVFELFMAVKHTE